MNIAHRIREISKLYPEKKSVVFSKRMDASYEYPFYTFQEFEQRSNQMAHFFKSIGIKKGTRTLLFVKPCLDFSVITFALFKVGAIPVLIDPGMGMKNLLSSVAQVKPHAMISIARVHWLRRLKPRAFTSIKTHVSLSWVGGTVHTLGENLKHFPKEFSMEEVTPEEPAAILFTSGGTGIPKGVIYTHGILNAQTDALKEMFKLDPTATDIPGFPLFALFTLAMGMTSVIPDMDPTKPAACDPKKLVKNILDSEATFLAGSPAIWERVGRYCRENQITLPHVKQVVMFGAPVRPHIHALFKSVLPNGDTYTPYGATECLPVSLISGHELEGKHGAGICIGQAVPHTDIKIINASDIPVGRISELRPYERGEIVVRGKQVTPAYFEMPVETAKAKIHDQGLWHRMGDVGYLDSENNLWFLGRKTHVVRADRDYYPIEIEADYNQHPDVKRSALISYQGGPALVVESERTDAKFKDELKLLGQGPIKDYFVSKKFPVDVRHNIKIDRVKLGEFAHLEKLKKL